MIACAAARPSLQLRHRYCATPSSCGDGALTDVTERAITVRVNGVASVSLAKESCRPDGALASVTLDVFGFSGIVLVVLRPSSSVAVSESSRWDGYSWSGATKCPEATPA